MQRKLNIAIVVNTLKIGGMERVAANLSDAFYESGHAVSLIYLRDKPVETKPRSKAIPIHLFNLKRNLKSSLVGMLWFFISKIMNIVIRKTFPIFFSYFESRIFKKELENLEEKSGRFDIVIFRGQGTFEHIWTIKDNRFVYVCENIIHKNKYLFLSKWVYTKLFSKRNIVCVSEGALSSLKELLSFYNIENSSFFKISNPNNFKKIVEDSKEEIALPNKNKSYILGLGRLVPVKNFELLIDAYHFALEKYKIEHDLLIVGNGQEKNNLIKKVDLMNLNKRVHFVGQKNNPFPWYLHADVFVLSSKKEGLGMVLLESLACDTKVVSTDSQGGVREIMNGELEQFLANETKESLGEKLFFTLNFKPHKEYLDFVKETLQKFNYNSIVNEYIKNFK